MQFQVHSVFILLLFYPTLHEATAATPSAAALQQRQPARAATCVLNIRGQPQGAGITSASLSCTGSTVAIAAVGALLGRHRASFQGVTWDQQQCGLAASRCLLAVCGGAAHVTLRDSTITGVRGSSLDAVLCVLGVGLQVVNSTMTLNGVTSILLTNASGLINGTTLIAYNAVTGDGGGIRVGPHSALHIGAASISYNNATGAGAGIHVGERAHVVIAGNASIAHNNASGIGAGISVGPRSVVRVEGHASLSYNVAGKDGGALAVESYSNVSVSGAAVVKHNTAALTGGGVAVWDHSVVAVTGRASIVNNTAVSYGGGIYVDSYSRVSVSGNVTISHNRVTRDSGGGLMCWVNSVVDIGGDASITHNSAGGEGVVSLLTSTLPSPLLAMPLSATTRQQGTGAALLSRRTAKPPSPPHCTVVLRATRVVPWLHINHLSSAFGERSFTITLQAEVAGMLQP